MSAITATTSTAAMMAPASRMTSAYVGAPMGIERLWSSMFSAHPPIPVIAGTGRHFHNHT